MLKAFLPIIIYYAVIVICIWIILSNRPRVFIIRIFYKKFSYHENETFTNHLTSILYTKAKFYIRLLFAV